MRFIENFYASNMRWRAHKSIKAKYVFHLETKYLLQTNILVQILIFDLFDLKKELLVFWNCQDQSKTTFYVIIKMFLQFFHNVLTFSILMKGRMGNESFPTSFSILFPTKLHTCLTQKKLLSFPLAQLLALRAVDQTWPEIWCSVSTVKQNILKKFL